MISNPEDIPDMISTIVVHKKLLTEWEIEFIDDMERKLDYPHPKFSDKQQEIIKRIYMMVERNK